MLFMWLAPVTKCQYLSKLNSLFVAMGAKLVDCFVIVSSRCAVCGVICTGRRCREPGLYPNVMSCHAYYICVRHRDRWYKFHMKCPPGLGFRRDTAACGRLDDCPADDVWWRDCRYTALRNTHCLQQLHVGPLDKNWWPAHQVLLTDEIVTY